jgi:hypothetical protein
VTLVEKVRLVAQVGTAIFTDAEIEAFLEMWENDVQYASAAALRAVAANRAKSMIFWRTQGLEIDRRDVPKTLLDVAKSLEDGAQTVPWEIESILYHRIDEAGIDVGNYPDGFRND